MAQPPSSEPPPGHASFPHRSPTVPSEEQRRKRATVQRAPTTPPPPETRRASEDASGTGPVSRTEPGASPNAMGRGSRRVTLALLGLALLPAWWTARTVSEHAVNTPFRDDWRLVDHLEALHHAQVPWEEFWRPVDGERSPLPQLLHIFALRLSGGDVRVDAWINLGCIAASSLGILFLLGRTLGWGWPLGMLYFVANLALFSPAQNLFAMRQAGILIPVACLVWALLLASWHGSTVLKFSGCALLAALAAGSGVQGLALLPAVPLLAAMAVGLPCRLRPALFTALWALGACAALAIYLRDWNPLLPAASPILPAGEEAPPGIERGFAVAFQLIASPLLDGWAWATPAHRVAAGATLATALLSMAAWALLETLSGRRRATGVRCGPWLLLGGSGLLGLAVLVATRLSALPPGAPFPGPGLSYGHTALPVLLGTLVPLHVLGREWITRAKHRPWWLVPVLVHASTFGTVIGLQSEAWFRGHEEIRTEHRERLRARVALHLSAVFPPANPEPFGHPSPEELQRRARFLHEAGYLQPPLLRDDTWPARRVHPDTLSLLTARVEPIPGLPGFRIIARLPGPGRSSSPAAGVIAATRSADDPTRYRLVARAIPDPTQPEAWELELPAVPEAPSEDTEIWALDATTMIAHRLEQRIGSNPDGTYRILRPTLPEETEPHNF